MVQRFGTFSFLLQQIVIPGFTLYSSILNLGVCLQSFYECNFCRCPLNKDFSRTGSLANPEVHIIVYIRGLILSIQTHGLSWPWSTEMTVPKTESLTWVDLDSLLRRNTPVKSSYLIENQKYRVVFTITQKLWLCPDNLRSLVDLATLQLRPLLALSFPASILLIALQPAPDAGRSWIVTAQDRCWLIAIGYTDVSGS